MKVLVTGGAGYIGSICVRRLAEEGLQPVVLDNLHSGHRWAVPAGIPFVESSAGDGDRVAAVLREHDIRTVLHFAARVIVPESIAEPLAYYEHNTSASRTLIEACLRHGVLRFIYSSTAAVYGEPAQIPIAESAPERPLTPYGASKLAGEWILRDAARSAAAPREFRYAVLRYFNVAGARPDATAGQATANATHLVKVAAEAACGLRRNVQVFGTDYATRDGTCIRDYIHVEDLVDAHVAALRYLEKGGASGTFNCGYGRGYTVREVLAAMQDASGVKLSLVDAPRRAGDPSELVADASRLARELRWRPRFDDLRVICESAYRWQRKLAERRA
jgi:UDP-glucose 4-epimerase